MCGIIIIMIRTEFLELLTVPYAMQAPDLIAPCSVLAGPGHNCHLSQGVKSGCICWSSNVLP